MDELDRLIAELEQHLDAGSAMDRLPQLLELSGSDSLALTKVYLLLSRCYFVANDSERSKAMRLKAEVHAASGPLEAQVRVALMKASLHTSSSESHLAKEALMLPMDHLPEIESELRARVLSVFGRNSALMGNYAEAIDASQEAITQCEVNSMIAAYSHGTIALVFQTMGRIEESEQFGLEQIRILTELGVTKGMAGLYSFLSSGAASVRDWAKAQAYQNKAIELTGDGKAQSAMAATSVLWMADVELELGNPHQALEYGLQALSLVSEQTSPVNSLYARIFVGRAYFLTGELHDSLKMLNTVLASESLLGDFQRMRLYHWLADTYKGLDRRAEAFDICYRLWELQTDFDNRTREALLQYHRALEQKIYTQKASILNMRTAQMERELALSATQLVAQVDLLGRFRNDLREIVRETRSDDPAIGKIKAKLKELPCQQIDWVNFEAQFSSVHPEFKSKLQEKHADLTRSEMKICALSRMKLTSEEIGRLLCLSERTVEVHRLNIRKKLNLKKDQNLPAYLSAL